MVKMQFLALQKMICDKAQYLQMYVYLLYFHHNAQILGELKNHRLDCALDFQPILNALGEAIMQFVSNWIHRNQCKYLR